MRLEVSIASQRSERICKTNEQVTRVCLSHVVVLSFVDHVYGRVGIIYYRGTWVVLSYSSCTPPFCMAETPLVVIV